MRCSGCGKDVPFGGQVCPYCQRDKSSDQSGTVATTVALIIGGFIGNAVGGFGGMLVGGFILGIVAAIITASGKNHSAKKAPRVRIEQDGSPQMTKASCTPAPAAALTIEDRLRRLDGLKSKGLITEEEHQAQRAKVLASI